MAGLLETYILQEENFECMMRVILVDTQLASSCTHASHCTLKSESCSASASRLMQVVTRGSFSYPSEVCLHSYVYVTG